MSSLPPIDARTLRARRWLAAAIRHAAIRHAAILHAAILHAAPDHPWVEVLASDA